MRHRPVMALAARLAAMAVLTLVALLSPAIHAQDRAATERPPNIVFVLAETGPARTESLRRRLREWRSSVGAQENAPNPSVDIGLYTLL